MQALRAELLSEVEAVEAGHGQTWNKLTAASQKQGRLLGLLLFSPVKGVYAGHFMQPWTLQSN